MNNLMLFGLLTLIPFVVFFLYHSIITVYKDVDDYDDF